MSERPNYAKLYAPMVGVALAVIAVDQFTKQLATGLGSCQDPASRPSTVGFCLAHNEGMAFSVGWGSGALISAVALAIVVVLFVSARKMPLSVRLLMGVIAGGATGNVLDRAFRAAAATTQHRGFMGGAVVDFIYSSFWATFNVADSAVVVGGFLLAILMWRLPDPADTPKGSAVPSSTPPDSEAPVGHNATSDVARRNSTDTATTAGTTGDRAPAGDEPGGAAVTS